MRLYQTEKKYSVEQSKVWPVCGLAQQKLKARVDSGVGAKPSSLEEGDVVRVYDETSEGR